MMNPVFKPVINTRKIWLILLLAMLGAKAGIAQGTDSTDIRDLWVRSMLEKVSIEVSIDSDVESFKVGTGEDRRVFKPNLGSNLRFHFRYRFISAGVQWAPHFLPGNRVDDIKGTSKSLRLRAALQLVHFNAELIYNRIRGYYLENTGDVDPSWTEGDPLYQFPNQNYAGFRLKAIYNTNANFSFRSITDQAERQVRSAGSFTPGLVLRHYIVDDRATPVGSQRSVNIEASIGPGYHYTFVFGKEYFFTLGAMASVGYLHTNLLTRFAEGDWKTDQNNFIIRGEGIAGIGYNGDKFYTGIFYTLSASEFSQQHNTVINDNVRSVFRFFIGFRFPPPRFLRRTTDKVKEIIPVL